MQNLYFIHPLHFTLMKMVTWQAETCKRSMSIQNTFNILVILLLYVFTRHFAKSIVIVPCLYFGMSIELVSWVQTALHTNFLSSHSYFWSDYILKSDDGEEWVQRTSIKYGHNVGKVTQATIHLQYSVKVSVLLFPQPSLTHRYTHYI